MAPAERSDDDATTPDPSTADRVARAVELLRELPPQAIASALDSLAATLGGGRLAREVLRPLLAMLEAAPADPDTRRLLLAPRWQAAAGPAPRLDDLAAVRGGLARLGSASRSGPSAGQVHALLLVQEVLHHLLHTSHDEVQGEPLVGAALDWLTSRFGEERVETTLRRFEELWGLADAESEGGAPRTEPTKLLELLLLLWVANRNPAFAPLRDLVDDAELERATGYRAMLASLDQFFAARPVAEPVAAQLFPPPEAPAEPLTEDAPAAAPPVGDPSPQRTLETLLERHGDQLGGLADRVRVGLGVLAEEQRLPFAPPAAPPPAPTAPPPPPVARRSRTDESPPSTWNLSTDAPWMERATLVAKHTLVWLDQLSREADERLTRLDQIPDRALAELREQGFDTLWLVGLWERSLASARLSREAGREDAAASAYSVREYRIADDLGGWQAADALAERCAAHGLTLGCDLVPNHTAIDSTWVLERPELFVQVATPPFPGYRFTGDDLSPDPRVELRLEDGYADQTDAAVVFERVEVATGERRYLYHGNDGTGLPWKDTAQLDYTLPAVRALMIEQIVTIATHFRMIRFDAAMTLTRRHFQRLWYPAPGSGGAVPSRAERGLTKAQFSARMPRELWAEVVAAVAAAAPETMLVAEAFWLMEPYFVRRLGMHRVYHSAFMHALLGDRDAELRTWVAEALAREPRELSRYVNFLTTPDEAPTAESFGTEGRYLAAATLLVALPGLPLFGHGQAEGLHEKYGMEYARAELDEEPDPALVAAHQAELAPLLARRELFADPLGLRLFEVEALDAASDPSRVWALANSAPDATAVLVVVNRGDQPARARIGRSTALRVPWGERTVSLAEALGLVGGRERVVRGLDGQRAELLLERDGSLIVELGPWERRILLFNDRESLVPPGGTDGEEQSVGVPSSNGPWAHLDRVPVVDTLPERAVPAGPAEPQPPAIEAESEVDGASEAEPEVDGISPVSPGRDDAPG